MPIAFILRDKYFHTNFETGLKPVLFSSSCALTSYTPTTKHPPTHSLSLSHTHTWTHSHITLYSHVPACVRVWVCVCVFVCVFVFQAYFRQVFLEIPRPPSLPLQAQDHRKIWALLRSSSKVSHSKTGSDGCIATETQLFLFKQTS